MAPTIEVVTERATLGEGPHWDEATQTLYYVDIFGQTVNKYVPATKEHRKVRVEGGPLAMAIPVEGFNDQFLVAIGRKLAVITWDGVSDNISNIEHLLEVENEPATANNRFNDGKADPTGRLWAGTMGPEPEIGKLEMEKGNLYTLIGKRAVKTHLTKVSIANGLAWNVELKKMYYIDSPRRTVDEYDYDIEKGEIANRKPIFNLDDHNIPGVPDGMTIDTDGNLWVAVFDGGCMLHVNPRSSELLNTIKFPARQITSAAFGGRNLDELYVTSAQLVIKGVKAPDPAGAVFKVTGTGAKGYPGDISAMAPVVQRIIDIPNLELGEGPHWDAATQSLYFVDIFGKAFYKYVPSTKKCTRVVLDKHVSLIIPVKGTTDKFVISYGKQLAKVTWDGVSDVVSQLEIIEEVDKGTEHRINDGKCDPSGRLWFGTMGEEPVNGKVEKNKGSLFSIDKGQVKTHVDEVSISNGLAWNLALKKMYYIDSYAGTVDEFDFDIETGTITNRTPIFTFSKHDIPGFPDGMTIDVNGNLWVACFNGYRVIKIDPRRPETLLETIQIPAKQVTSVAFGGPDLDVLYVTSASFSVNGIDLPPPDHGATYKVTGLQTNGLPGDNLVL